MPQQQHGPRVARRGTEQARGAVPSVDQSLLENLGVPHDGPLVWFTTGIVHDDPPALASD